MRKMVDHLILSIGVVVFCAPLLLLVMAATRPGGLDAPSLWPGGALAENLSRLWALGLPGGRLPDLGSMLFTSGLVAAAVGMLNTVVSFLAAYALVYFRRGPGRGVFWLSLATLYFPVEARLLPTFDVVTGLGLLNTMAGLVLPVLPLAVGTFLFRQDLRQLPDALAEAARLDGAGPLRFLWDIVLPLSRGPIALVLMIGMIWGWNQYLWPLMVSVDDRHWTLMRGLQMVSPGSGAGAALAVLAMLPALVLVLGVLRLLGQSARFPPRD